MHPEIENLINMAIADGEVTDKERAIILRKADVLGEDLDEVEMILDGKIAILNKKENTITTSKSSKEGDIKKCPACGATAKSFTTICPDCSHEFRNIQASNAMRVFEAKLLEIENTTEYKDANNTTEYNAAYQKAYLVSLKKAEYLTNFNIPNTKEDILEFLSIAVPQANIKISFFEKLGPDAKLKNAWRAKCEQIIMKARFAMKDDKKTLDEIEFYAKQLNIK
jgi:hypothetical protein